MPYKDPEKRRECSRRSAKKNRKPKEKQPCEVCGDQVYGRSVKYCSKECKRERDETIRRGPKWKMVCQTRDCNNIFYTRHNDQRYCSAKCRGLEEHRRKSKRLKKQLLEIYGSVCSCCGEDRYEFLTLEHKDGSGKQHRKENTSSYGSWIDAIENVDPDRFTILCMNCNWSKGRFGYCPHEREGV